MQEKGINDCEAIASFSEYFYQNLRLPLTQKWGWVEN